MIKTLQKILFLSLFFFVLSVPRTFPTEIDGKEFTYHSSILLDEDSTLDQTNVISSELYDIAVLAVNGAKVRINSNLRISKIVPNVIMRNPLEDGEEFQNSDDYKYGLTSAIVAIGMNTEIGKIADKRRKGQNDDIVTGKDGQDGYGQIEINKGSYLTMPRAL